MNLDANAAKVAGAAAGDLAEKLAAVRKSTLAIYAHLTPRQMQVPHLPTVNPPLWELGHLAWFQEYWCRRSSRAIGQARLPSRYPHFDDWYNSSVIAHAPRWALPHPDREVILQHLRETLDDTLLDLAHADPARHYFFELEAQRRLPTEAEWEFAATGGGTGDYPWGADATLLRDCTLGARSDRPAPASAAVAGLAPLAHLIGNVWEWTSTPFAPYAGFAPDPYVDYSAPWFGDHTVLRGGSFVTSPWLIHGRFRNFYKPERRDMFAGFRTCALG